MSYSRSLPIKIPKRIPRTLPLTLEAPPTGTLPHEVLPRYRHTESFVDALGPLHFEATYSHQDLPSPTREQSYGLFGERPMEDVSDEEPREEWTVVKCARRRKKQKPTRKKLVTKTTERKVSGPGPRRKPHISGPPIHDIEEVPPAYVKPVRKKKGRAAPAKQRVSRRPRIDVSYHRPTHQHAGERIGEADRPGPSEWRPCENRSMCFRRDHLHKKDGKSGSGQAKSGGSARIANKDDFYACKEGRTCDKPSHYHQWAVRGASKGAEKSEKDGSAQLRDAKAAEQDAVNEKYMEEKRAKTEHEHSNYNPGASSEAKCSSKSTQSASDPKNAFPAHTPRTDHSCADVACYGNPCSQDRKHSRPVRPSKASPLDPQPLAPKERPPPPPGASAEPAPPDVDPPPFPPNPFPNHHRKRVWWDAAVEEYEGPFDGDFSWLETPPSAPTCAEAEPCRERHYTKFERHTAAPRTEFRGEAIVNRTPPWTRKKVRPPVDGIRMHRNPLAPPPRVRSQRERHVLTLALRTQREVLPRTVTRVLTAGLLRAPGWTAPGPVQGPVDTRERVPLDLQKVMVFFSPASDTSFLERVDTAVAKVTGMMAAIKYIVPEGAVLADQPSLIHEAKETLEVTNFWYTKKKWTKVICVLEAAGFTHHREVEADGPMAREFRTGIKYNGAEAYMKTGINVAILGRIRVQLTLQCQKAGPYGAEVLRRRDIFENTVHLLYNEVVVRAASDAQLRPGKVATTPLFHRAGRRSQA